MSTTFEPRDHNLWFNISRDAYWGLAAYVIIVILAFLRDLFRKTKLSHRRKSPLRFLSPSRLYSLFLLQYRDTKVFYYVEFLRLAANVTVCSLYVVGTYKRNVFPYIREVNRIFASFFLIDIVSQVASSESAIDSVLSWFVFFDMFSFPSLILASGPNGYLNFSFLRSIAAYGAYSRLERRMFVKIFTSKRLVGKLAFQCFTLFYTLAAGIQLLEIPGDLLTVDFRTVWDQFGEWNFFNSAYFVIVTLSTVGYGDFSPSTVQGRVYTILMIIVGIVIFTSVIGELVEHSSRGRGSGWFVKHQDSRHVIVTGTPKLNDLVLFTSEFYSDSRQSNANANVVVLVESPTWSDVDWYQYIARNQFLQTRLTFLIGSVRNNLDLQRARISTADAVFFLTSPSTGEEPSQQDSRTVMNILAVRNVRTDIPIFAQTLLHDSKLQTRVALTTPSTFSKETFFRGKEMKDSAAYPGMFHEVLRAELEDVPRVHRKEGRDCFQDVMQYHTKKLSERDTGVKEKGILPDLHRSRLVCLQEVHTTLIAANIRVNGVATLVSNMYLDVQGANISRDDPPWLSEYHMGAACSLCYAIIPKSLDGVQVSEIGLDLFHMGLLLIGTSDAKHVEMQPVLKTDSALRRGDIAMLLTYHRRRDASAGLHLVGIRRQRGELKHIEILTTPTARMSNDSYITGGTTSFQNGQLESKKTLASSLKQALGLRSKPVSDARDGDAKSTPNAPIERYSTSTDKADTSVSCTDILGSNLMDSQEDIVSLQCSDGSLPDNLSGHVIVAMEGDAPLRNLSLFLRNLWRKDRRKSLRKARKQVVVVIHPAFSDQYKALYAAHEKTSLFFVEGSPSSSETWKRAGLHKAKAVATMADYTQPWHVSDARTIFTLLTLDVNTTSDHDLFICSELLDEKSLEFLREPGHTRRRGAMLGESVHALSPAASASAIREASHGVSAGVSSPSSLSGPTPGAAPVAVGAANKKTFRDPESLVFMPVDSAGENVVEENAVVPSESAWVPGDVLPFTAGAGNPITAHLLSNKKGSHGKNALDGLEDAVKMPVAGAGNVSVKSGNEVNISPKEMTLTESTKLAAAGVDPANKPGAARARRGSLFSRSRYASGELLIHSSAITLIAREYIEPGFSNFFENIMGAEASPPGLKIRLLRIPALMFECKDAVVYKNGQRLIPYVHIFKALISGGVTPLGIYRSGCAPALIPSKGRRKRGAAILKELENYLDEIRTPSVGEEISGSAGVFRSLLNLVLEVAPWKVREARGRHEVNGNAGVSSGSESSDDEDDDTSDSGKEHHPMKSDSVEGTSGGGNVADPLNHDKKEAEDKEARKDHLAQYPIRKSLRSTSKISPGRGEFLGKFLFNDDESFEVPGQAKYREETVPGNLLPYVYTLPDPNTLCAEADGIYVLGHPSFDLGRNWLESKDDGI